MFEHMLNMLNRDSFLKEILELGKKIWNIEVTHSWTCRQVEVTDEIFSFSLADMDETCSIPKISCITFQAAVMSFIARPRFMCVCNTAKEQPYVIKIVNPIFQGLVT